VGLEVIGLDGAVTLLEDIASLKWTEKSMTEYGQKVIRGVSPYPPPPPQSTYRRTGNLGRKWYLDVKEKEVEVGNVASYAGWVQDEQYQVAVHDNTGWETIQFWALEEIDNMVAGMVEEIESLVLPHV